MLNKSAKKTRKNPFKIKQIRTYQVMQLFE